MIIHPTPTYQIIIGDIGSEKTYIFYNDQRTTNRP